MFESRENRHKKNKDYLKTFNHENKFEKSKAATEKVFREDDDETENKQRFLKEVKDSKMKLTGSQARKHIQKMEETEKQLKEKQEKRKKEEIEEMKAIEDSGGDSDTRDQNEDKGNQNGNGRPRNSDLVIDLNSNKANSNTSGTNFKSGNFVFGNNPKVKTFLFPVNTNCFDPR